MMPFAWHWAQVGDRVHVHDREAPYALTPGVVARVRRSPHGTDVSIRLESDPSLHRIGRQWVHNDPMDPAENCPLCAVHLDQGQTPPVESPVPAAVPAAS